jgi:hypothetical protein
MPKRWEYAGMMIPILFPLVLFFVIDRYDHVSLDGWIFAAIVSMAGAGPLVSFLRLRAK